HGLADVSADLLGGVDDLLVYTDDEVAALDLDRSVLTGQAVRRAEGDLDLLGAPLPDEKPVVLSDVLDDRLVHLVAGDPDRVPVDGARHGDDGHLGRPAADGDDQVTARLWDRQARAERGCRRLLDQVHLARVGLERRVSHGWRLDMARP